MRYINSLILILPIIYFQPTLGSEDEKSQNDIRSAYPVQANPIKQSSGQNYFIEYFKDSESVTSIQGVVFDKLSGHPLADVTIQVDKPKITVVSGSRGKFLIERLPNDMLDLWISMVGYETIHIPRIRIKLDSTIAAFVFLKPAIFRLGREVTVKGVRKPIVFPERAGRPIRTWPCSGTIVNSETGVPLFDVLVMIEELNRGTKSNMEGYFLVRTWPQFTTNLRISTSGYDTLRVYDYSRSRQDRISNLPIEMDPAISEIDKRRHAFDSINLKPKEYPQIIKK
jgi:hypothetical protein